MKIDYLLTGDMRGNYLEVRGTGVVDRLSGAYDLNLDIFNVAPEWDPVILPTMCCTNLNLFAAKLAAKDNALFQQLGKADIIATCMNHECGERSAVWTDENGEAVVRIAAKGYLFIRGDTVYSRTVVRDAWSRISTFGGAKSVIGPHVEKFTPTTPRHAVSISTYQIECANGARLHGQRVYPYGFNVHVDIPPDLSLSVETDTSGFAAFNKGGRHISFKTIVSQI